MWVMASRRLCVLNPILSHHSAIGKLFIQSNKCHSVHFLPKFFVEAEIQLEKSWNLRFPFRYRGDTLTCKIHEHEPSQLVHTSSPFIFCEWHFYVRLLMLWFPCWYNKCKSNNLKRRWDKILYVFWSNIWKFNNLWHHLHSKFITSAEVMSMTLKSNKSGDKIQYWFVGSLQNSFNEAEWSYPIGQVIRKIGVIRK